MEEEKTKLSKNANRHGEMKVRIVKTETVTSPEASAPWPLQGLGAVGLCQGRSRAQGWAETPWGPWGAERHPPESPGCHETWHLKSHPDL